MDYLPVTCLLRYDARATRWLPSLRAQLEAQPWRVQETGEWSVSLSTFVHEQFAPKQQQQQQQQQQQPPQQTLRYFRLSTEDWGLLLFAGSGTTMNPVVAGESDALLATLIGGGYTQSRPLLQVRGKQWRVVDEAGLRWELRCGVVEPQGRGAATAASAASAGGATAQTAAADACHVVMALTLTHTRHRADAPQSIFKALAARLLGADTAAAATLASHENLAASPSPHIASPAYNRGILTLQWFTLLTPDIKAVMQGAAAAASK